MAFYLSFLDDKYKGLMDQLPLISRYLSEACWAEEFCEAMSLFQLNRFFQFSSVLRLVADSQIVLPLYEKLVFHLSESWDK